MNIKVPHSVVGFVISSLIFILLIPSQVAQADSSLPPTVVSFSISPSSVDVITFNNVVTFDLSVSSATGIISTQTLATFTNGSNSSIAIPLIRTDSPVNNSQTTVEFKGKLVLPNNFIPGAYTATAMPVVAYSSSGIAGYPTPIIIATSDSKLIGAINAIQVRSGGSLNLNYPTFVGPTFNTLKGVAFSDPKYFNVPAPIWKVGEIFTPSVYYQLNVPSLSLKVKSSTPAVCASDGISLRLTGVGPCSFTVFTDQTVDYQSQLDNQIVTVSEARIKPSYTVGTIATQSSSALPLSIAGPFINGPLGLVMPVSLTPSVCYPAGTYITVISGGTCTFNYSSPASANYQASDVFPLTFEITRAAQGLSFIAPASVERSIEALTLTAKASSNAPVTFQTNSPAICSVTGNSLYLLAAGTCQVTALQAGSTTLSPTSSSQSIVVRDSIVPNVKRPAIKGIRCGKKGVMKTIAGTKCPAGSYTK